MDSKDIINTDCHHRFDTEVVRVKEGGVFRKVAALTHSAPEKSKQNKYNVVGKENQQCQPLVGKIE